MASNLRQQNIFEGRSMWSLTSLEWPMCGDHAKQTDFFANFIAYTWGKEVVLCALWQGPGGCKRERKRCHEVAWGTRATKRQTLRCKGLSNPLAAPFQPHAEVSGRESCLLPASPMKVARALSALPCQHSFRIIPIAPETFPLNAQCVCTSLSTCCWSLSVILWHLLGMSLSLCKKSKSGLPKGFHIMTLITWYLDDIWDYCRRWGDCLGDSSLQPAEVWGHGGHPLLPIHGSAACKALFQKLRAKLWASWVWHTKML